VDGYPLQTLGANGRVPACVVDVRLSLGVDGLFWVLGLARTMPVWLVQTHWAIVEDPFYLTQESLVRWLAGSPEASIDTCRAAVAESCSAWRDARRELTLETRPHVYWPAERLREASVPKRGWPDVVAVCDALAAGIDRRRQRSPETVDTLADCARDGVALAAALGALGEPVPFLLTRLAAGETEPDVARCLHGAGIPCRLIGGRWAERLESALAPSLIDAGLATALLAGSLRLALIQLVAPQAMIASAADDERVTDTLDWDACADGAEGRHLDGAAAVFLEVSCET
jgi:hypothetical protein